VIRHPDWLTRRRGDAEDFNYKAHTEAQRKGKKFSVAFRSFCGLCVKLLPLFLPRLRVSA